MDDLSVLIPTTDHYQDAWEGLWLSWELLSQVSAKIYVVSDSVPFSRALSNFISLTVGKPEYTKFDFSNKIIHGLKKIDTKYVLLMCDDMWPSHPIGEILLRCLSFIGHVGADALKIHEKFSCWDYSLEPTNYFIAGKRVLKMGQKSRWLLSHNATIWNRDFLISVMEEGEDPWTNELKGTRRIAQRRHNIYHFNHRWYFQFCNFFRGKLTGFGKATIVNLKYMRQFNQMNKMFKVDDRLEGAGEPFLF